MSGVRTAVLFVIGYLVGSVPVAGLVARRHGVADLRRIGDRNPGYWNAKETMGRRAALPVFLGDTVKGAVAAGVGVALSSDWRVGYVVGGAAMVGHAWPVFAGFRGGRSVLTFTGAICVLAPLPTALAIGVLLIVTIVGDFAWGARVGIVALPFVQLAIEGRARTAATGCLMTLIGLRFVMAAFLTRSTADAADHATTGEA
jgi:glycerol-3-phosphate acyltransferase PlsY